MIYPFQNSFAETLMWYSSRKMVCIKSWAFPVVKEFDFQFLRKMNSAYLFCLLLSPRETCEEDAILVEAKVSEAKEGHKGLIVGPAIYHREGYHRSF